MGLNRLYIDKRRAKKYGTFVEDISSLLVLEREDGLCGICGKDVDPKRYHVDHMQPVSENGAHAYHNVQVAHPWCNWKKGNYRWDR